jgi:hypothetical protein
MYFLLKQSLPVSALMVFCKERLVLGEQFWKRQLYSSEFKISTNFQDTVLLRYYCS